MNARSMAVVASIGVTLGLGASLRLAAAPSATQAVTDPMAAMLAEVHARRLAMERSAAVGPHVQLTLARLNIEEQRTTHLGAQLDQVRRQLRDAELESKKLAAELEDVDRSLQAATDNNVRRSMELEQAQLKRKATQQAIIEQELRTRENDAAQLLNTEQARWIELNARLDELERLLAPVR